MPKIPQVSTEALQISQSVPRQVRDPGGAGIGIGQGLQNIGAVVQSVGSEALRRRKAVQDATDAARRSDEFNDKLDKNFLDLSTRANSDGTVNPTGPNGEQLQGPPVPIHTAQEQFADRTFRELQDGAVSETSRRSFEIRGRSNGLQSVLNAEKFFIGAQQDFSIRLVADQSSRLSARTQTNPSLSRVEDEFRQLTLTIDDLKNSGAITDSVAIQAKESAQRSAGNALLRGFIEQAQFSDNDAAKRVAISQVFALTEGLPVTDPDVSRESVNIDVPVTSEFFTSEEQEKFRSEGKTSERISVSVQDNASELEITGSAEFLSKVSPEEKSRYRRQAFQLSKSLEEKKFNDLTNQVRDFEVSSLTVGASNNEEFGGVVSTIKASPLDDAKKARLIHRTSSAHATGIVLSDIKKSPPHLRQAKRDQLDKFISTTMNGLQKEFGLPQLKNKSFGAAVRAQHLARMQSEIAAIDKALQSNDADYFVKNNINGISNEFRQALALNDPAAGKRYLDKLRSIQDQWRIPIGDRKMLPDEGRKFVAETYNSIKNGQGRAAGILRLRDVFGAGNAQQMLRETAEEDKSIPAQAMWLSMLPDKRQIINAAVLLDPETNKAVDAQFDLLIKSNPNVRAIYQDALQEEMSEYQRVVGATDATGNRLAVSGALLDLVDKRSRASIVQLIGTGNATDEDSIRQQVRNSRQEIAGSIGSPNVSDRTSIMIPNIVGNTRSNPEFINQWIDSHDDVNEIAKFRPQIPVFLKTKFKSVFPDLSEQEINQRWLDQLEDNFIWVTHDETSMRLGYRAATGQVVDVFNDSNRPIVVRYEDIQNGRVGNSKKVLDDQKGVFDSIQEFIQGI